MFKKITIRLGTVCLLVTPLITTLSCSHFKYDPIYDHLKGLRGQGSSSAAAVMQEIQNSVADFQYEGSGSGDGLKVGTGQISNKDFGITSALKHPEKASDWENIRTITWAIDAIGIILKMPADLNALYSVNNRPIIDGTVLVKLYDLDASNDQEVTWENLLVNLPTSVPGAKQTVIAQGRDGGVRTSGTAEGFFHKLPLVSGKSIETLDVNHEVLRRDRQTAEANSAALMALQGISAGLTYISLGYGLKQETDSNDLKVASIQTFDNKLWEASKENVITGSYKWTRPFNAIYNVTNQKGVDFATFLLAQVQSILESLNFFSLSEAQISLQINDSGGLTVPDKNLVADVTTDILGLDI